MDFIRALEYLQSPITQPIYETENYSVLYNDEQKNESNNLLEFTIEDYTKSYNDVPQSIETEIDFSNVEENNVYAEKDAIKILQNLDEIKPNLEINHQNIKENTISFDNQNPYYGLNASTNTQCVYDEQGNMYYINNIENLTYNEDSNQSYTYENSQQYQQNKTFEYDSTSSGYSTNEDSNARRVKKFINPPIKTEKPYVCEICLKKFSNLGYLKQHHSYHHTGRNIRCPKCGKRFTSKNKMDEHFLKHTASKPFKCTMCSRDYNFKTDLDNHMEVHIRGKRSHLCSICNKNFPRKDHMEKHYKTHMKKKKQ